MEPQDTFDLQARIRDHLDTVFAHRFVDVDRVREHDALRSLAEMFPKQWAEWTAFAGPGSVDHFADFTPIRLAIDVALDRFMFAGRESFTADDVLADLREHEAKQVPRWLDVDPLAHVNELERLVCAGWLIHADDGRYIGRREMTGTELDGKSEAYRREGARLHAHAAAFDAETDYLKSVGHFDDAGRPRGHADWGKPIDGARVGRP